MSTDHSRDYGRGIYDPRFQTLTDTVKDAKDIQPAEPPQRSKNRIRKKGAHPLATNRLSGKSRRNQCIRLARRDGGWFCHWCYVNLSFDVEDCRNDIQELRYPTIDHIITKSRGGNNNDNNCVLACQDCNSARSSKKIERKFK